MDHIRRGTWNVPEVENSPRCCWLLCQSYMVLGQTGSQCYMVLCQPQVHPKMLLVFFLSLLYFFFVFLCCWDSMVFVHLLSCLVVVGILFIILFRLLFRMLFILGCWVLHLRVPLWYSDGWRLQLVCSWILQLLLIMLSFSFLSCLQVFLYLGRCILQHRVSKVAISLLVISTCCSWSSVLLYITDFVIITFRLLLECQIPVGPYFGVGLLLDI